MGPPGRKSGYSSEVSPGNYSLAPPTRGGMAETSVPRRASAPAQTGKKDTNMLQRTSKNMPSFSRPPGTKGQTSRPVLKAHRLHAHGSSRVNAPSSQKHPYPSSRPPKRGFPDTTDSGSRKRPRIDPPTPTTAPARSTGRSESAKPGYLTDKGRPFAKTSAFDQCFREAWANAGKISKSESDQVKSGDPTAKRGKPSKSRTEGGKSGDPRANGGTPSTSRIKGSPPVDLMIKGPKSSDLKTKGNKSGDSRRNGGKPSDSRSKGAKSVDSMIRGVKPGNSRSEGDKTGNSKAKTSKSGRMETQGETQRSWRAQERELADLKALIRSSIFNISRSTTKAGTNPSTPFRGSRAKTQVVKPPRAPSPPKADPFFPFFRLPRELRDKIYGHVLHAPGPVTVLKAWTQCYGRYRGGIEPAILCVNKQTAAEGAEILYSTNTFSYLLRDNGVPVKETTHSAGLRVSADRKRRSTGRSRLIYLTKYAHLIRRLELVVESNRADADYGIAISKALVALRVAGVRPLELSFSLKPRLERGGLFRRVWSMANFFSISIGVIRALRELHYGRLRFNVLTPRGRRVEMVLDGQAIRAGHRVRGTGEKQGEDRFQDPWAKDLQVQEARARRAEESLTSFNLLSQRIEQACENTDLVVENGWWREVEGEDGEEDDEDEDREGEEDVEDEEDGGSEEDDEVDEDGEDGEVEESEKRGKVKKCAHFMANAQSVDASQERIRKFEESIRPDIGPKRHRFWCVARVNGNYQSYIA